jgi:hypothetical protein
MPAGGKRPGAGRPKGSRALTLLAPTGERMAFYEAARQYDQKALQVIASILMDAKQPASLRLAAANDLLDRGYGRPPVSIDATTQKLSLQKIISFFARTNRWLSRVPLPLRILRSVGSRLGLDGHAESAGQPRRAYRRKRSLFGSQDQTMARDTV